MALDIYEMAVRILVALAAGALIGYERSYRGRPAGFRTHALVCMASSMLMLITVYEAHWVRAVGETVRLDPTHMAQGIMTGIADASNAFRFRFPKIDRWAVSIMERKQMRLARTFTLAFAALMTLSGGGFCAL